MTTQHPLPGRWEAVRHRGVERARPNARRLRLDPWRAAAVLLLGVAAVLWTSSMAWGDRPTTSAPLILPLAAAAGLAIAARAGRRTTAFDLTGILAAGLSLRLVGLWLRYRDAADAIEYHEEGTRIAATLRGLELGVDAGRPIPGTGSVRVLSGVVHAVSFDDLLTSFAVFTLVAFVGSVLLVQAFRVGVPAGDLRRYAIVVMVWPSLWFWPSSLGKESLMLLGLGASALGAAHLLGGRRSRGLAWLAAGLVVIGFIRPHVGLLVVAGLGVAALLRPVATSAQRRTGRFVGAAVLMLGGAVLSQATADRLQLDATGADQVTAAIELTADRTATGSATFDSAAVSSPVDYPMAVVTVLLRPFPHEATGVDGLVAAGESLALMVLAATSWRRLRTTIRDLRRVPYLMFSLGFVATFCFAFSAIANFGILARQRSQVLPFVFVLLCTQAAPAIGRLRRRWLRPGGPRHHGDAGDPPGEGDEEPEGGPAPVVVGPTPRRRPGGEPDPPVPRR